MIMNQQIKIIDLGFAMQISESGEIKGMCGTACYMAPEMIMKKGQREFKGLPVDCWALGVLLYVLLVGTFPFSYDPNSTPQLQQQALFDKIIINKPNFPSFLSSSAISLIQHILNSNPNLRYTINKIQSHHWLQ